MNKLTSQEKEQVLINLAVLAGFVVGALWRLFA